MENGSYAKREKKGRRRNSAMNVSSGEEQKGEDVKKNFGQMSTETRDTKKGAPDGQLRSMHVDRELF